MRLFWIAFFIALLVGCVHEPPVCQLTNEQVDRLQGQISAMGGRVEVDEDIAECLN